MRVPARFVAPAHRGLAWQFARFLLVGGGATLLHYAMLIVLHRLLGIGALLSTSLGFLISAVCNFFASYHFTYQSTLSMRRAAGRYAIATGAGLLLNGAVFWTVHGALGVHYLAAQVVATMVVMLWSFSTGRVWAFASN
jgi:putative flippase GtrA